MKTNKGNGVVILDQKFYDNATQELISDTSKFEKLNEDPTLKCEASLQRFLRKLNRVQINFSELHRDKLCEKNLLILVLPKGSQQLGLRDSIF